MCPCPGPHLLCTKIPLSQSLAQFSSEFQTQRAQFCYISTINMETQNQHMQNNCLFLASLSSTRFRHVSQHSEWQLHHPNQKPGAMFIHHLLFPQPPINNQSPVPIVSPPKHFEFPSSSQPSCLENWEAKLVQV